MRVISNLRHGLPSSSKDGVHRTPAAVEPEFVQFGHGGVVGVLPVPVLLDKHNRRGPGVLIAISSVSTVAPA
jgi:hypothetical protein